MKKLLKFVFLLSAILPFALTACPDYPTVPTTSPKLVTSTSTGISNFPKSTQQFSVTMMVALGDTCSAGSAFHIFSMKIGTTPDYFKVSLDCSSLSLTITSSWFNDYSPYFTVTSANDPIALFFTFDLGAKKMKGELQTAVYKNSIQKDLTIASALYFDANSEFYFCSDSDETSTPSCSVSSLIFEYRYYGDYNWPFAHLGGTYSILSEIISFYPLSAGSLTASIGSAGSAYFGDSASNPTAGTSPSWDSSNEFVLISTGQFLTVPLPNISPSIDTILKSFSFAAWVYITDIPSTTTTIFAMSDGSTQVGYKLTVSQSTNSLALTFGSTTFNTVGAAPTVTLNEWQLIGFTAYLNSNAKSTEGTVFVGASSYQFYLDNSATAMDLSSASVIRIGDSADSISGRISVVRIMTPGGGITRTTDLCSSKNNIELGVDSFALTCSGTNVLSTSDNTCSACTSGYYSAPSAAGGPLPSCLSCPNSNCDTCDSTECLTCMSKYFLYQGECLSSCPAKTYVDGPTCKDCSSNCDVCTSTGCSTCTSGYFLYEGACSSSCPDKTYATKTTCEDCSDNCAECNSSGCTTCNGGYQLNTDKTCELIVITTESSGLSGGVIAAIACGSVILVSIVGYIICHLIKGKPSLAPKYPSKAMPPSYLQTPSASGATASVSPTNTEARPLNP